MQESGSWHKSRVKVSSGSENLNLPFVVWARDEFNVYQLAVIKRMLEHIDELRCEIAIFEHIVVEWGDWLDAVGGRISSRSM